MSGFLQVWISREGNCDTLTAQGGQALLQKIKEVEEAQRELDKKQEKEVVQQLQ